jgi:hypothetical protein
VSAYQAESAVGKPTCRMVDSGAGTTVSMREAFPKTNTDTTRRTGLCTITGGAIEEFSVKQPVVRLGTGNVATMSTTVTNSNKNARSVAVGVDNNLTTCFGPGGHFITSSVIEPPEDLDKMMRVGNNFYIPVWEMNRKARTENHVIAPIIAEGESITFDDDSWL